MVSKATNSLKEEHELLRTTLLSIRDAVIAVNSEGKITFMNHVAEQLTGFVESEAISMPLCEVLNIINTDNSTTYEVPIAEVIAKGRPVNFNSLNMLVSKSGNHHLVLGSASPINNEQDEIIGVLVAFQDISEKMQAEETIKYHKYYDSLTDLPNRMLFNEYLNSAFENASMNNIKLAVLVIDLDYFKIINDILGHNIGDILLQCTAKRLTNVINENCVLARMGEDEFTVLMTCIERNDQAADLAHKAMEALGSEYSIEGNELYVTASIGIAVYPDDGLEPGILLKHADAALNTAKKNGRNLYQSYSAADDKNVAERFSLTKDLHMAIERNEMSLNYQPKVNSTTGEIVGMEALVRWNHPERGLLSPGVFIPLAEENGLIKKLDVWVLRTACLQFKSLADSCKKPLRLSVNISAHQFRNHNLVHTVEQTLKDTSFDPSMLELEITETTAMENIDFTVKTLKELNEMGVNISIDDFGTGYSSLNYLKYLPIHILKIDRSFVCDMEKDTNTMVIVKSIIDVAHSLKLKVTAEGVETEEQLSMLKQMDCDEIQGYLISKPLPLLELQRNMLSDME
jgi:polar amino acid transport system substrate-binding protein